MVRINLTEENLISTTGVADRRFADHSGDIQQGYELGSLTRGLVAYYAMEEGQGQVLHDGALDNLGQINGPSWNGSGQVGSDSLSFDGTDDFVIGDFAVNPQNSFTASCWVKVETLSTTKGEEQPFLSQQDGSGTGRSWLIVDEADDSLHSFLSGNISDANFTFSTNTWTHVTITYDDDLAFYVNGSETASNSITPESATGSHVLGAGKDGSFQNFDGELDDVRIYDRALSQPEIEALAGLTEPSGFLVEEQDVPTLREFERDLGGAVSRYEFENDVTDSWGDNDGTNNGVTFVDGVYGQAGDFELANGDSVTLPNFGFDITSNFTISAWFNPDDLSNPGHTIIARFDGADDQLQLYARDDNDAVFQLGHSGGNQLTGFGGTVNTGNWYQVVGIYKSNPSEVEFYFNGSLTDTDSGTIDDFGDSTNLSIGSNASNSNYFDGQIDDVRIYSRALTPIEVETLFNKGAYRIKRGNL